MVIHHDSHDILYREPFGAVAEKTKVTLRLKVEASSSVERVYLRLWKDGREKVIPMKLNSQGLFEGRCVAQSCGIIWYYFIIHSGNKIYYYCNNPSQKGGVGQILDYPGSSYQITVYKKGFTTPAWFKEAVVYQIFVDRFCNGTEDGSILNPREDAVVHSDWYEKPYYWDKRNNDFFGGNLLGIIKKLPYLKDLGITALYLNPIFEAFSNHKYDTGDYYKIDPMFGDNKMFEELCAKAQELGIAVILDGVFSHTGSDSIYFNKEGRYASVGAYQGRHSPYHSWYQFYHYPEDYDCWWGFCTLPNVNELEPSFLDFVLENDDSVVKYWIKQGASGWRIDVADELPDEFLRRLRTAVKQQNPDGVLIGEVWEDASNKCGSEGLRQYLLGEQFDSVMNYPFRGLVLDYLCERIDSTLLHQGLMSLYENYPKEAFYAMVNLIGSHDVVRALTILQGAPSEHCLSMDEQAGFTPSSSQKTLGKKRMKLAVLFQMTFPGAPSIYYGDEAGMEGYKDPLNRCTYPWGKENKDLLTWHKKLIHLRHEHACLRTGLWTTLYAQGDVYVFRRQITGGKDIFGEPREDGQAIIMINRSRKKRHELNLDLGVSVNFKDVLHDNQVFNTHQGNVTIDLGPLEGRLLIAIDD
ncbi:MAG: glycoside hydrolase family 13 protein [Limnochordia bacterium]|nr:glycoside hydrolase family 13 protein [Limnochordia bacterium]